MAARSSWVKQGVAEGSGWAGSAASVGEAMPVAEASAVDTAGVTEMGP
jgi:hypothetical protein